MIDGKKVVATIEARMTSSRLPGKVLMPLAGKPVLEQMIERLRRSKYVDEVVVATTTNTPDDAIVEMCERIGAKYWRGSENDVLVRVLDAAKHYGADIIVETCGDEPCIDHRHVDGLLDMYVVGGYDYVSNSLEETFPIGFDVKIFSTSVLDEVNRLTQDVYDHEHVSLYIYNHPERYKLGNMAAEGTMRRRDIRVTLDTREDYEFLSRLYDALYPKNPDFSAGEVIDLCTREPSLLEINKDIKQKPARPE